MSVRVVHRPARVAPPSQPTGPPALAAPPRLPDSGTGLGWYTYLFPVLGSAGAMVFVLVNPNPLFMVGGAVFMLGAGAMGIGMYLQQRGRSVGQLGVTRRRYLRHLEDVRGGLRAAAEAQWAAQRWRHPDPAALSALATDPRRRWERRRDDDDALQVRVGSGRAPLQACPTPPGTDDPLREHDPVSARALDALLGAHATVDDVAVTLSLRTHATTTVVGDPARAAGLVRALVAQLVTWHAPDDVRLAVFTTPDRRERWEWVKWAPHAAHPEARGPAGPLTLVATHEQELSLLLGAELGARRQRRDDRRPHLLVVVDRPEPLGPLSLLAEPEGLDVSLVVLVADTGDEPPHVDARLWLHADGTLSAATRDGQLHGATPDALCVPECRVLARRLAGVRLLPDITDRTEASAAGLADLLGVVDVGRLDARQQWRPRPLSEQLRVPIGIGAAGQPVELDLKESALGGMGPHGLVVGATGSGKSELLRTLVTGLALRHSPDELALVLVDYKGGATFANAAALPHCAGLITNLEDDETMVQRMHDALRGELHRRERLLRDAGNLSNLREYRQRRTSVPGLPPLPSLLVVVDEFSELLAANPDFIDLFVAVGRLGRSLGMHLLLATQRLEEGRLRGLESHLSYRIGMRTFSAGESRIVLGTPDAFELPSTPGAAYLKVDTSVYERLRTATVSLPYIEPHLVEPEVADAPIVVFDARPPRTSAGSAPAFVPDLADPDRDSVMDVVVRRLAGADVERAHQVWLSPLPDRLPLGEVLPGLRPHPARGLQAEGLARLPALTVPIGVMDLPSEQRQASLLLDLAGAGGNLAVAGAPQTGKSTALRTLVLALAARHTPRDVQVYGLDFSGGLLAGLADLPHVGGIAGRLEVERVRRVLEQVTTLLEHRERTFPAHGIDSPATFRARRADGSLPDDGYGDVFLLIDAWPVLREEFEDLEGLVTDLAARGLGYGIHVAITTNRWLDVKPKVLDSFGARLELRLAEATDSTFGRAVARALPADVPGRALSAGGTQAQIAVPTLHEDVGHTADDAAALRRSVQAVAAAWQGPPAPPVRLLPTHISVADLPPSSCDDEPGMPFGLSATDLGPVCVDLFGAEPHLLVLGDGGSGKTNVLRLLLQGLTAERAPDDARILVVDYRRTLLGEVPDDHLLAYAGNPDDAGELVRELAAKMRSRQPGSDLTPAQLRARSWWEGAEAVLIVDDADLVVTQTSNPLEPLVPYLPQARDLGLHVVLARRVAGMARSAFEPVLRRMLELHTPGLLMSGSRDEGPLLDGHRASEQVAGRGLYVRRGRRPVLVQTALLPDTWSPDVR